MVMFVLPLFVSFIVVLVVWWYVEFFKYNKYLRKYSGPWPLPIIGNAHLIGSVTDVIPVITALHKKHGEVFKMMFGHKPRLLIAEPKLAEFLLRSSTLITKSYEYKFFHPWLGTGLLTSWGSKWKTQRKLLTPAFHFQILEQFIEVFNVQSDILVENLKNECHGQPFDIFPYVTLCALDVICEATMGTSVNAQKDSESSYVKSVKDMCRIVIERIYSPMKMTDLLFYFTNDYEVQKKALDILHGYANYVINKRRQTLFDSMTETHNSEDTGIKKRMAFLDLLLQSTVDNKPLSDESIREEVDTFMFEGHDTTTSGISFALYLLSRHSEVQEKVREELKSIFGNDKERYPTYEDLQNMKYLEMVIKEALRLYPPVPAYARFLEEDVEYDGDVLPKGISLTIFAYQLHRNSDIYPDPEKFDPERFSLENSATRSPYAYVPFSAGPRNCIGQRFAMLELKSTVSKVLRHFELLPALDHKPILAFEAILKSANGLKVRLRKTKF